MSDRPGSIELFSIVLDSDGRHEYLAELGQKVGFRYVLASHVEVFHQLLELGLPASLFIIRFERYLNHQLKAYLDVLRQEQFAHTPVLLIANEQTENQARTILERKIDEVIVEPFSSKELIARTGTLLRRSSRNDIRLSAWLRLEGRIVQGQTTDISSTGCSVTVPDPILSSKFDLTIFPDEVGEGKGADFGVVVRRKEKLPDGGYTLGLQILTINGGEVDQLQSTAYVHFREPSAQDVTQF